MIALGLFVLINAILGGLYLWSQGGQHVRVRVEARGDQFVGYVDGRRQVDATFPTAPQAGGIVVTLEGTESLPGLPEPRGIDRVRVTDLTTGQLLFEDDFSDGPSSQWQSVSTTMKEKSGVLGSDGLGVLILVGQDWRDVAVDVDIVNAPGVAVAVRVVERGTGVEFGARPLRHYDNSISQLQGGQSTGGKLGLPVEVSRVETAKGLVFMILRPYPLMFLLLAAAFVLVLAVQWLASFIRPIDLPPVPRDIPWLAAAWLVAAAFGVTLYLNYSYSSHVPHVPDEVAYLFQAKIFASGRLAVPPPPVDVVFDYFYPPFIIVSDGKWSSVYTFGHSAVLAVGTFFGVVWLVPSLVGAGTVALTFAIGRKLYATRVGLLAAAMLASSPFFLMSSSNFMSHNTVAFFLLASMFLVIVGDRRPLVYGALGGLCFGFLFNTRPLETTVVMPAFGLLLASRLLPPEGRSDALKQIGAFMAGGLVMLAMYFLYNLGTTGDAFSSALQQGNEESKLLGFGGEHTVSQGVQNEHIQMLFLVLVLHGWPVMIGLGFVLLPLILASRSPWDWFLLLCALSIMTVYLFFRGHGIMHGPRYWYPAAPLLMLLAARGADRAAGLLSDGATYLRQRLPGDGRPLRWAGVLVVYPFVVGLIYVSVNGWLMGREQWWADEFVPARAQELKGFNGTNDRLLNLIEDSDLSNALVLIDECNGWQCYGSVFWANSPGLDGDIVWARQTKTVTDVTLAELYPGRDFYLASYDDTQIRPTTLEELSDLVNKPESARGNE